MLNYKYYYQETLAKLRVYFETFGTSKAILYINSVYSFIFDIQNKSVSLRIQSFCSQ